MIFNFNYSKCLITPAPKINPELLLKINNSLSKDKYHFLLPKRKLKW